MGVDGGGGVYLFLAAEVRYDGISQSREGGSLCEQVKKRSRARVGGVVGGGRRGGRGVAVRIRRQWVVHQRSLAGTLVSYRVPCLKSAMLCSCRRCLRSTYGE